MRNFLLAGNVAAIAASTTIDKAPAGALGFYYMKEGVPAVDTTGKLITGYGQIVMGRASKDGGPIIIPFYNKDFSYSKSTYSAAETFTAEFTVPEPVIMCDHTVIFTKKGIQFNERSNWTASIHVFKDSDVGGFLFIVSAILVLLGSTFFGVLGALLLLGAGISALFRK